MSRIRIVQGTITKTTAGDHNIYTDGSIVYNSGTTVTQTSDIGINYGDEPKDAPKKEGVKEIEVQTKLGLGSKNDNSGKTQEGFVFGNEYILKVKQYLEDKKPENLNMIRWSYSYISDEGVVIGNIDQTGEEVKFKTKDLKQCGKTITFYAYIRNKEKEATLDVFHHYRFRWFDREKIKDEVGVRKLRPWLINQEDTNTCGPSAIMYAFAKKDKEGYSRFILDLHGKGYAKYNNYVIDISSDTDLENISDTDPNNTKNFPLKMSLCDWISNICITDKENAIFDYEGSVTEDFSAITLPGRLKMLNEKLLGFKNVIDNTNLYFNKTGWIWGATIDDIADLINAKEEGYEVYLLVGINMLYNTVTNSVFATAEHWIVLESIKHGASGYVELTVYTWGRDPSKKVYVLSYDVFRTNYYGYVKAK
jgi:hypothetical protein